jgi:hypothetical protein
VSRGDFEARADTPRAFIISLMALPAYWRFPRHRPPF